MPVIIAFLNFTADIQTAQFFHILSLHAVRCIRIFIVPVYIPAVKRRNACRIFRFFHPALNFEGINSGIQKLWQKGKRTHILHAERIAFLFFTLYLIRKPARLRTSSPIAAPAAKHAAEQALT